MDYSHLRAFRDALSKAPHLTDLKSICRDFCSATSMPHYMFAVCEAVSLTSPRLITVTNFPTEWVDHYLQRRASSVDPILQYSFSNTAPILWSELEYLPAAQGGAGEGKAFIERGRAHGLHRGLTVPLSPPSGQTAFFCMASSDLTLDDDRLGNLLPAAGIFSNYLFDAYIRIDKIENPKVNELTERELECVFWACEGKTAWEMAQIVGVAERTINFHLTSVIKKLGASNRQHAVAKAVMYGLVKPRA
ncbi:LuxR family transcriptional regulator [Duganella sp. sic0402]|uniref:LuxR family transcriptional regulator n=1 Tax=Duganella sp. sic0402 TaxID=2854786 RepID=UPI0021039CD1|nr:LuxR family transcriptional regulator [Duganella sp. sic0402]